MKHMNALPLKGVKVNEVLNSKDYIIQDKLKGIRAFIYVNINNITIITRGGHDITRLLPHIINEARKLHPDYIYDCELFCEGVDDAVLSGWLNPKRINPVDTSKVVAYIFDCIDSSSYKVPLLKRLQCLENNMSFLPMKAIRFLPYMVAGRDEKLSYIDTVRSEGGEGVMLKNLNAFYIYASRPANNWYKFKFTETYDVIITGFKKGRGKYNETIGSIIYGAWIIDRGYKKFVKEIGTVSGMDDELRIKMGLYQDNFIGKVIEVKAQEVTINGCLENPVFLRLRSDKMAEECIVNIRRG